ncbi:MAG: EF-hand domain-containing protein [Pseudomonadota bacterium]
MKHLILPIALLGAATAAWAMTSVTEIDGDGDGVLTLDEMQLAYPDMTAELFEIIDVDANGVVDADEIAAADAAELLPQKAT